MITDCVANIEKLNLENKGLEAAIAEVQNFNFIFNQIIFKIYI